MVHTIAEIRADLHQVADLISKVVLQRPTTHAREAYSVPSHAADQYKYQNRPAPDGRSHQRSRPAVPHRPCPHAAQTSAGIAPACSVAPCTQNALSKGAGQALSGHCRGRCMPPILPRAAQTSAGIAPACSAAPCTQTAVSKGAGQALSGQSRGRDMPPILPCAAQTSAGMAPACSREPCMHTALSKVIATSWRWRRGCFRSICTVMPCSAPPQSQIRFSWKRCFLPQLKHACYLDTGSCAYTASALCSRRPAMTCSGPVCTWP